jgi:hypothetical protein
MKSGKAAPAGDQPPSATPSDSVIQGWVFPTDGLRFARLPLVAGAARRLSRVLESVSSAAWRTGWNYGKTLPSRM